MTRVLAIPHPERNKPAAAKAMPSSDAPVDGRDLGTDESRGDVCVMTWVVEVVASPSLVPTIEIEVVPADSVACAEAGTPGIKAIVARDMAATKRCLLTMVTPQIRRCT